MQRSQREALVSVAEVFTDEPPPPSTEPRITIKQPIEKRNAVDTPAPKTVSFAPLLQQGTRRSSRSPTPRTVMNIDSFRPTPRASSLRVTSKHGDPSLRVPSKSGQYACNVSELQEATKAAFKTENNIQMPLPKGYAYKAFNPNTRLLAEYKELILSTDKVIWGNGMCNKLGRLFQGYKANQIVGTNTCRWIHPRDMPKGRKATYIRVVVAHPPQKVKEPFRVRLTVGGDKVDYPGPVTSKTTDLITAKLLLNSVVSTLGSKFLGLDIKDYFLGTPLSRMEYAKIAVKLIPKIIMDLYDLYDNKVVDGYVWFKISRGMYGLPQAARVAYDALVPRLAKAGYREAGITNGLFKHDDNGILFCLTVDDFGIRYPDYDTAQHLVKTLKEHYKITEDWKGEKYCGLDLVWNLVALYY